MSYFNFDVIKYEGSESNNPLSFKQYNADEVILGKTMKEHLRFAMSWWHTLSSFGADQFGEGSQTREWIKSTNLETAKAKVDAGFEFMQKLGIKYFCFHDRDLIAEGKDLA